MFLYSKFAYGSQFSGEKNGLWIRYIIIKLQQFSWYRRIQDFFLKRPVGNFQLKHLTLEIAFITWIKIYFLKHTGGSEPYWKFIFLKPFPYNIPNQRKACSEFFQLSLRSAFSLALLCTLTKILLLSQPRENAILP